VCQKEPQKYTKSQ